jgi:exonuclease SbcC
MTVPAGSAKDADVEKAAAGLDEARQKRAEAEAARAAAIAALEASKIAAREADRRSQEAQAAVEGLEKGVETARKLAEEAGAELSALVGSDDGEAAISAMQEELAATAAGLEDASAARDRAREDHDEAIQAEQATGKRVTDLRVALTTIAARLDDAPEVSDDVDSIGDAAATLRVMVEQSLGDTLQRRELAAAVAKDQRKALGSLIEAALITEPFDEALAALRSRVQVVGEEISRAEEQLADAADSRARRDAEVAAMKTYQALAGDLTDARFVRFLLDDERRRLAELGSEHFQRLSNGRYRFTEDGAFDVVDLTAADAVRKADSLSGGETFLASLGLALALAEIVSRGGGRLDAFFLDEGFGTLDSEHLDLAMEGIESLVSDEGNRLVVVVSHVPELRHRVEDLIELDRSPTTGDTRVLSA